MDLTKFSNITFSKKFIFSSKINKGMNKGVLVLLNPKNPYLIRLY